MVAADTDVFALSPHNYFRSNTTTYLWTQWYMLWHALVVDTVIISVRWVCNPPPPPIQWMKKVW
jgi:hypothetical protein